MNRKLMKMSSLIGALVLPFLAAGSLANTLTLTEGAQTLTCSLGPVTIGTNGVLSASVTAPCFDQIGVTDGNDGGGGTTDYTLTTTPAGTGSGTITSSPSGISCGATCSASYTNGTEVSLTAAAATGSVFAGWSGACTGTGPCSVSMTAARNVDAYFNTVVASGADPGTGLWNPDSKTFVHDPGNGDQVFVPRCIPNDYTRCQWGGSASEFDTIKAGEVWAMRIKADMMPSPGTTSSIYAARAETGESLNSYDVSVSPVPGDFENVGGRCLKLGGASMLISIRHADTPSFLTCNLAPGVPYYFNVRPAVGTAEATQCGANSTDKACRYRIVY